MLVLSLHQVTLFLEKAIIQAEMSEISKSKTKNVSNSKKQSTMHTITTI